MKKNYLKRILLFTIPAALLSTFMQAQCTVSCGTGNDGAYVASSNTTLAGGTYNYSSFTINPGVTVNITGSQPLVILCTGNVQIDGTLNVSGTNGVSGVTFANGGIGGVGVGGGANGGNGTFSANTGPLPGSAGNGAGSGGAGGAWSGGGGAGYATAGANASASNGIGGPAYGNPQISPAVAGSGGAGGSGGYNCGSGGGGGGGGYVSISVCGTITIGATGSILANGGNGGSDGNGSCGGGGGGSGGSILLLITSTITNNGAVSAIGGNGGSSNVSGSPYFGEGGDGANGRIYYRSLGLSGTGSTSPIPTAPQQLNSAAASQPTSCNGTCDGALIGTVFGGAPNYTYNWMPGNYTTSAVNNVCAGTYILTGTDANGCTTLSTVTVTSPAPIVITTTITNASCACDGSVTANVSGGTGPYTYLWLPGNATAPTMNGLCAGCYTLTVTDAIGCTQAQLACITAPAPLVTTVAQQNDVTCNGACNGTATVLASGGAGPITYSWAPTGCNLQSCTNLCAGSYSVTAIDSLGCTSTQTFSITEPMQMQAVTTSTGVSCFGDCTATAAVSVFGGTPNYTVLWAPGGQTTNTITGQCAGTYTVTATDANGCTITSSTTVTEPSLLQAVSTSIGVSCFGDCTGTAIVSVTGGTPTYTVLWNPANQTTNTITGLCSGAYTATATDANGCTTTTITTVTQPSQLVSTSTHTDETSSAANNGTATAATSGGTPGYTYLWMPGSQTTATASALDAGTYTCTITDANGCTSTTTVTVGTAIGVDAFSDPTFTVNLFPNPAQDQVQLSVTLSQKGNVHVELYNIVGEKIDARDFGNVNVVNQSYEVSQFANGIYFFRITSGSVTTTKKITVSH